MRLNRWHLALVIRREGEELGLRIQIVSVQVRTDTVAILLAWRVRILVVSSLCLCNPELIYPPIC